MKGAIYKIAIFGSCIFSVHAVGNFFQDDVAIFGYFSIRIMDRYKELFTGIR